ncbi:hypothetical protein ACFFH4_06985 [Halalkalibacter alkalisediminis]|uniref:YtxH domain-containing protein n=1 Tax=Halalkalibacter alkalisediminis TaxID=935616 RepID=A0ABV6NDG9_9BACI
MVKNGYVWSTLFGGVLGAAGVLMVTTEQGKKWRKELVYKINQIDGASVVNALSETSKDWAEFGDVVKVKTRSTKNLRT